jgi:TRAP-type C4-dicarboxylate transport system permease small subunit
MQTMRPLLDTIHRTVKWLVGMAFLAIFALYVVQIVLRYLFGATWLWAPDLVRLLFVWTVFLGATALYRSSEHLSVDFFVQGLGPQSKRALGLATEAMSAAFFLLLVVKGWEIAEKRMRVPFDTWDLPTGYAYAAAPVCAFFMLLIALDRIYTRLRDSTTTEDDGHAGKP